MVYASNYLSKKWQENSQCGLSRNIHYIPLVYYDSCSNILPRMISKWISVNRNLKDCFFEWLLDCYFSHIFHTWKENHLSIIHVFSHESSQMRDRQNSRIDCLAKVVEIYISVFLIFILPNALWIGRFALDGAKMTIDDDWWRTNHFFCDRK